MAAEAVHVVQFLHPGREHRPGADGRKPWNNRQGHRRAFVKQLGRYVRTLTATTTNADDLRFWCEWECEAELIRRFEPPDDRALPRYLFRPIICRPNDFSNLDNTDPCVFGDRFRYCACQQPTHPVVRQLAAGAVILFGSHLGGHFVLDTVFVVARAIPYGRHNYRKLDVPEAYRDAALAPLFAEGGACAKSDELQLYEGATFEEPCEGMFSFTPCMPGDDERGFPRPSIQLPGYVNPALQQGLMAGIPVALAKAVESWRRVTQQVLNAGLCLGVYADMPRYESSKSRA